MATARFYGLRGRTASAEGAEGRRGRAIRRPLAPLPWSGNTYVQAVTWDDECPVADTVLATSQSSDPESPHYADQTVLYSRKEWVRFPYC